jgi:hypothetical protein
MTNDLNRIPRCDQCWFWKAPSISERPGTCHRRAPHPAPNLYMLRLIELVAIISWQHATKEEQEGHIFRDHRIEDAVDEHVSWPRTCAEEWCGEFELKEIKK